MSDVTIIGVISTPSEINTSISTPATIVGSVAVSGPKGDTGIDAHYVYIQSTPADIWTIEHTLSKYPSVTIVDSSGTEVVGDVEYLSLSTIRVSFVGAFSGKAYLN